MPPINIIVQRSGFEIFGVEFNRRQQTIEGWTNPDRGGNQFPRTYEINTITNYSALKHLAPSGKRYVADNDNDMGKYA
jgi:hypothetical protein